MSEKSWFLFSNALSPIRVGQLGFTAANQDRPMTAIRQATPGDNERICALLAAAGLPTADLPVPSVELWVAEEADGIVGVVGVQHFGQAGLLRSLVVDTAHRGSGLGAILLGHAQNQARATGLRELFLLTETAAVFFTAHGYRAVARDLAPADVLGSSQFRLLCPASAVCMTMTL
ncbi:hypothetical protein ASD86_05800 [Lysobacter sp. Root690]|nr:hypothetical protein ASD86_05800 [Lysobacter sp. Root690]